MKNPKIKQRPEQEQHKLPCGCELGYFLCPEAERLWRNHNVAYYNRDYPLYDTLREAYHVHKSSQTSPAPPLGSK